MSSKFIIGEKAEVLEQHPHVPIDSYSYTVQAAGHTYTINTASDTQVARSEIPTAPIIDDFFSSSGRSTEIRPLNGRNTRVYGSVIFPDESNNPVFSQESISNPMINHSVSATSSQIPDLSSLITLHPMPESSSSVMPESSSSASSPDSVSSNSVVSTLTSSSSTGSTSSPEPVQEPELFPISIVEDPSLSASGSSNSNPSSSSAVDAPLNPSSPSAGVNTSQPTDFSFNGLAPSSLSLPNSSTLQDTRNSLRLDLGGNASIPLALDAVQKAKLPDVNKALNCMHECLDELVVPRDSTLTWLRYDFATKQVIYQLDNQPKRYVIDLETFSTQASDIEHVVSLLKAQAKTLEELVVDLTGKPISHIAYDRSQVTLAGGPRPFQKVGTPALEARAKDSFEVGLKKAKKVAIAQFNRLGRNVEKRSYKKKIRTVRERLEKLKTTTDREIASLNGNPNKAEELAALQRYRKDLEEVDGYAIGLTVSAPQIVEYNTAVKNVDVLTRTIITSLAREERASEGRFAKKWEEWFPSSKEERAQHKKEREKAGAKYAADIAGLIYSKNAVNLQNLPALRRATTDVYTRIGSQQSGTSIEHEIITYLAAPKQANEVRAGREKAVERLTERFAEDMPLERAKALARSIIVPRALSFN